MWKGATQRPIGSSKNLNCTARGAVATTTAVFAWRHVGVSFASLADHVSAPGSAGIGRFEALAPDWVITLASYLRHTYVSTLLDSL